MKLDALKQYSRLRNALIEERSALEKRLSQINEILGLSASAEASSTLGQSIVRRRGARRGRTRNSMSLKQAIVKATQSKPLTKDEILAAVKRFGYKFSTARPMATLNAYLYRKAEFERKGGRFSPRG
jgi:hypothetical protein